MVSLEPAGSLGWGPQEVRTGMSRPQELRKDPPRAQGQEQPGRGQRRDTRDEPRAEAGPSSHLTSDLGLPQIQGVAPQCPTPCPTPLQDPQVDSHLLCSGAGARHGLYSHPWSLGRQCGVGDGLLASRHPSPHAPPRPALFRPQASSGSCTRLPQPLALRGPRPQGRRVERKCCS